MAFAIKARLEGVETALAALGEVARTVRNKVLRKAVNAASRLVLDAARALVPKDTGMLRKSLGVRIQTYRGSGKVVAVIGPRTGYTRTRSGTQQTALGRKIKETGRNPSKYAHLVEYGHALVRGGKVAGSVPAKPFLRPAFETNKGQLAETMSRLIAQEIEKIAKRMGGK